MRIGIKTRVTVGAMVFCYLASLTGRAASPDSFSVSLQSEVDATVSPAGNTIVINSSQQNLTGQSSVSQNFSTNTGIAQGAESGTAMIDLLQGSASGGATPDPGDFTVGRGFLNIGFTDTFTVTSTTLPPGTPVDIQVALVLTGSNTLMGATPTCQGGSGNVDNVLAIFSAAGQVNLDAALSPCAGLVAPGTPQAGVIQTVIGNTLPVKGSLELDAFAAGTSPITATADGTAFLTMSAPDGVSILSAGGGNYAPPAVATSEPSSLLLLGAGLLGLLVLAARSKRHALPTSC
jgi:hypothetical protein